MKTSCLIYNSYLMLLTSPYIICLQIITSVYMSTVQQLAGFSDHGKICEKWVYITLGVSEKLLTFSPINTLTFQSSFIVQPSSCERRHSTSPVRITRLFLNFTLDLILYYEEPSVYLQSPLKPPFSSKLDSSDPEI